MRFRRGAGILSLVGLTLLMSLQAPASAQQVSQGRTFGGTAYGVANDLVFRRPGIPAGQSFRSLAGATTGSNYYYSGYQTDSAGAVTYVYGLGDGGSVFYGPLGGSTVPSGDRRTFVIRGVNGTTTLRFEAPNGASYDFNAPPGFGFAFPTVLSRMETSSNTFLSGSTNTQLLYQASPSNTTDFRRWGNPVAQFTTASACGNFPSGITYNYSYAFFGTC